MKKTVFRYFFDFMDGQEKWLNEMAEQGWRLTRCGIASYGFERCDPGQYEYRVEFAGDRSYGKEKQYRAFLDSMGYRTFTKNLNLDYSRGKVAWRPWVKGMGQIATSPGGYNRELLIVEKEKDGGPFELHTDLSDRLSRCRPVVSVYAWRTACILVLLAVTFTGSVSVSGFWLWALRILLAALLVLFGIPFVKYYRLYRMLRGESETND